MSVAMPNPIAGKSGGSVSIFGRKVSYDALLLAGASLAGVFFLYKVGQANQQATFDTSSIDPNAGSAGDFATVSTQPPQTPAAGAYWGVPFAPGGTLPAISPSTVLSPGQPSSGAVVQYQGLEGSGGGPNTTGRSSGSQILPGASTGGSGSGGHASPSSTTSGGGGSGSGGPATGPPQPTGTMPAGQNAQGKSRSSGGQIAP